MKNRKRKRLVFSFAAASLVAVAFAVYLSLDPDKYFFYRPEDRAKWVYDPGSVALLCALMLAEAGVACIAVAARRPRVLWLRSLLGLVVLVPWARYSTMFFMHMPFYVLFHHLWVWLLVLMLCIAALGSGMSRLYLGVLRKAPPEGPDAESVCDPAESRP